MRATRWLSNTSNPSTPRSTELAKEAGAREPEALANALFLLMDGAYMAARFYGNSLGNPAALTWLKLHGR